jgi:N6-L-threonylcarbamoyladenine synthase
VFSSAAELVISCIIGYGLFFLGRPPIRTDGGKPLLIPLNPTYCNLRRMHILAIETSCDDTAAAVVDANQRVLSSVISSQDEIHTRFGGIVPELASRRHIEMIRPVVDRALARAGTKLDDIDLIAATQGPGLVGSLLVGFTFAKALALVRGLPAVGVDHMAGHLLSCLLEERPPSFPYTALIVSGGNTSLFAVEDPLTFTCLGRTRDDAAGEAFDKVAKLLGLGYPGGPVVSQLAAAGDPTAIAFPRARMGEGSLDFSFSGLKTSVATAVARLRRSGGPLPVNDICASFQEAVVEVLVDKTLLAIQRTGHRRAVLGGGVAANPRLRKALADRCAEQELELFLPAPVYCTDNAAMIGVAGYHQFLAGLLLVADADAYSRSPLNYLTMTRVPTAQLLNRQGLAPNKKLGQNFLVNERVPRRIVDLAGLQPDDTVIEVGVGLGALTRPLAVAVARVIGLEADSGIVRLHEKQQDLPANVELMHADVLKVDLPGLVPTGQRLKIVANLPYSISTPFLFRLIDQAEHIDSAVVMLQEEVAVRLMASPGCKEYGVPTVLLAACAEVRPLLSVSPAEFHPRPRVNSLVVRITFQPVPQRVTGLAEFDRVLFTRIVHAVFGQRRKTLLNGLTGIVPGGDRSRLAEAVRSAGIDPSVRAETLSLEGFVDLTRGLTQLCQPSAHLPSPTTPVNQEKRP